MQPIHTLDPVLKVARYQELLDTLREAGYMARAGDRTAGYRRLLEAARRGEHALAAGEPWGEDLAARYHLALQSYARQYHLVDVLTVACMEAG